MNHDVYLTPLPGDRVISRCCSVHGEIASRLYDPPRVEISVRWNDGALEIYDVSRFVSDGPSAWELTQ